MVRDAVSVAVMMTLVVPGSLGAQIVAPLAAPVVVRPVEPPRPVSGDPILALREANDDGSLFKTTIRHSVERHPAIAEARATEDEAKYGVSGARQQLLPRIDTSLSSYRVIAREFSNDPFNIIERSRPRYRTDALISAQQTLWDFGAASQGIRAAISRYKGARADAEVSATQVAVSAIAAYYDVFGYRALTGLSVAYLADQRQVRVGMQERIMQGVSADADLAGVDSAIARAQTRLATYRRGLANAEARFEELNGAPAPDTLPRAPAPGGLPREREQAAALGKTIAGVRSADATAAAVALDARVTRDQRLPQVTGGIDAGRYGVFENPGDFDLRGSVTIRQRFLGGARATINQAKARAAAADAHADRVREEASRDASIAWADVDALQVQLDALQSAYIAARQSRDATLERFTATRGTLFDVLSAQQGYFDSATAYIQGIVDLDAARYVLLARTDKLLPEFAIDLDRMRDTRP